MDSRIIVLGFDGVDPKVVREMIAAGELPHLARLDREGTLAPLATTNPAESPVSWAAFSVGANPGQTGIFDFLHRIPGTYIPDIALVRRETMDLRNSQWTTSCVSGVVLALLAWLLLKMIAKKLKPKTRLLAATAAGGAAMLSVFLAFGAWLPSTLTVPELARDGTPFWKVVGDSGECCSVLQVPVTFPAKAFPEGRLLTGLGTPDVRQTWGSYSIYAEEISGETVDSGNQIGEEDLADGYADAVTGGKVIKIGFPPTGPSRVGTVLFGPPDPMYPGQRVEVRLPLEVERDVAAGTASFHWEGKSVTAREGDWTDFLEVKYQFSPLLAVDGIVRFRIRSLDPFYAYASPVSIHPEHPPLIAPLSAPHSFSAQVVENTGQLHESVGWAIATNPLKDELIDEDEFLEDLNFTFENRWKIVQSELKQQDWRVLVAVMLATDRVQHMFWRTRDPKHPLHDPDAPEHHKSAIADVYRRMDEMIGEVLEQHVDENTDLYILSDHGFASYRKSVHINSWLIEKGYLVLQDPETRDRGNLVSIFAGLPFSNVDWTRTRAYSFGLGKIYLNRIGREPAGIVSDEDAPALMKEIIEQFLGLRDPDTGEEVVRSVYRSDEIYQGPHSHEAGDLVVGFHEGYRVSWDTAAGSFPPGIIEKNLNKWSGDHCSVDPPLVPGFIASNRKLNVDDASVIDLAPTILQRLGLAIPDQMEGHSLSP